MSAPLHDYRELRAEPPRVRLRGAENGVLYLSHPDELRRTDTNLIAMLDRCCRSYVDRAFLAERAKDGWRGIGYAEFAVAVSRAAGVLAVEGLAAGTRVGILAGNGIDHAIASFAIVAIGGVAVPLSAAYLAHPGGSSLLTRMAQDAGVAWLVHADGLTLPNDVEAPWRMLPLRRVVAADALMSNRSLQVLASSITSSQAAKVFFTSGSTGSPKVVEQTHGMLCAAAAMVEQIAPRTPADPPVLLDWLPWTHVYGGNINLHSVMQRGGTLYIDGGAPLAGRFDVTLRNLRELSPTQYTTVPAAYPMLIEALESDTVLARNFFSQLHACGFGGAALDAITIERFQALSQQYCGQRMPFGGGYGMTETCGILSMVWWTTDRGDSLGLPVPGVEFKLVPLEGARWECRVRGPNVFSGYSGAGTGGDFDDEGFFATGDALELADPQRPERGLIYGGRLREDFKLANGSWVRVARLREALLQRLRPLAAELIVLGENRDAVAVLVWIASNAPADTAERLRAACREFNEPRSGATERIARLHVTAQAPDATAGEITPKGTINARAVVRRRNAEIEHLLTADECRV